MATAARHALRVQLGRLNYPFLGGVRGPAATHAGAEGSRDRIRAIQRGEQQHGAYDINRPITPTNYAALRTPFNSESPSLNPNGGLATLNLANPHSHQSESNDDMVVIADVFSNGTASVADVMHAPRDRRMLDDFQAALRNNAVFVPSSFDRRAGTMRVVFSDSDSGSARAELLTDRKISEVRSQKSEVFRSRTCPAFLLA